jgi:hypothetical protein
LAVLQFMPTDLSGIAVEAQTLDGLTFAFCDHGSAGKAEVESVVTRLGGKVQTAAAFLMTQPQVSRDTSASSRQHVQ